MDIEQKYLTQFILNLCEGNYADANSDLRSVITEKMQKRIKGCVAASKKSAPKGKSDLPAFLKSAGKQKMNKDQA